MNKGKVLVGRVTVSLDAFVLEDDVLTPLPTAPVTYPAKDWTAFDLDQVTKQIQQQYEESDGV